MDEAGKLWRVIGYCSEPTVTMEEVEPQAPINPALMQSGQMISGTPGRIPLHRDRKSGGISGLMWNGFKRIYKAQT